MATASTNKMQQGTFIDLVLLRVNGGQLNDEGAVQRSDIRAYIPIAINYVTSKAYYINRKEEGDRDFPGNFYGTFSTLVIDRSTKIPTITLPSAPVSLPSNQGIRNVTDDCGNTFTPISDSDLTMINFYSEIFTDERFYRWSAPLTIQLYNVTKLAKHVNAVIMIDPTAFTDDTELPIQAGMEQDVLDMAVQHFTAQRQQPADVKDDQNDLNAQ